MPKVDPLAKLQQIILSFPETSMKMSWRKPHFYVQKKIFTGCSEIDGKLCVTLKLEPEHTDMLLATDPRCHRSRYAGCIELELDDVKDWDEVRALVAESYRQVAPPKLVAAMQTAVVKKKPAKKKTAAKKKSASKKKSAKRG
jgi:predicted DNA-binding protein (MmcQ/YjbR family)